jgi:hypothetical protein
LIGEYPARKGLNTSIAAEDRAGGNHAASHAQDVCSWHKADIAVVSVNVRFPGRAETSAA